MKTINSRDNQLYRRLYFLFRVGISISLFVVIFGFILLGITESELTNPIVPPDQFFHRALELDPLAVITLGILILILVPFSSVILSMASFLMRKDRLYLGISIAVLCILFLSLFLALV